MTRAARVQAVVAGIALVISGGLSWGRVEVVTRLSDLFDRSPGAPDAVVWVDQLPVESGSWEWLLLVAPRGLAAVAGVAVVFVVLDGSRIARVAAMAVGGVTAVWALVVVVVSWIDSTLVVEAGAWVSLGGGLIAVVVLGRAGRRRA